MNLGLEFLMRDYLSINGSMAGFPLSEPTTAFLAHHELAANHLLYNKTYYDVQRLNNFLSKKHTMNKGQAAAFQVLDNALSLADTLSPAKVY